MIIKVTLASGDCSELERMRWQKTKIVLTLMVEVGESSPTRYSSSCEGTVGSSRLTSCFIRNFQPLPIHPFTIRRQEKGAQSETA